jgi:palmitoyl-protein thioesterase
MCPFPKIINLITFGSPHQGLTKLPTCEYSGSLFCKTLSTFTESISRNLLGQKYMSLLTLWRSDESDVYKSTNTYLSVINNELNYNRNFVENLLSIRRMILVKHTNDKIVIPNESAWFGYKNEFGSEIPLEDTETYRNDNLGLRSMLANGKIIRLEEPGSHIAFNPIWIIQNIIPYIIES